MLGHLAEPWSLLVDDRLFETRWAASWNGRPRAASVAPGREKSPNPEGLEPFSDLGSIRSKMVGVTGFEPATSSSRTTRATKLRHTPTMLDSSV